MSKEKLKEHCFFLFLAFNDHDLIVQSLVVNYVLVIMIFSKQNALRRLHIQNFIEVTTEIVSVHS